MELVKNSADRSHSSLSQTSIEEDLDLGDQTPIVEMDDSIYLQPYSPLPPPKKFLESVAQVTKASTTVSEETFIKIYHRVNRMFLIWSKANREYSEIFKGVRITYIPTHDAKHRKGFCVFTYH